MEFRGSGLREMSEFYVERLDTRGIVMAIQFACSIPDLRAKLQTTDAQCP
jgi:hypothetical protein